MRGATETKAAVVIASASAVPLTVSILLAKTWSVYVGIVLGFLWLGTAVWYRRRYKTRLSSWIFALAPLALFELVLLLLVIIGALLPGTPS